MHLIVLKCALAKPVISWFEKSTLSKKRLTAEIVYLVSNLIKMKKLLALFCLLPFFGASQIISADGGGFQLKERQINKLFGK
jgi:hypothetical protein